MSAYKMLIGGQLCDGFHGFDVINPADETVIARAPEASVAQLDLAVDAAREAFPAWARMPMPERGGHIRALAQALEQRQEDFARLLTQEQGKPLAEARGEIAASVALMRQFSTQLLPEKTLVDSDVQRIVQQWSPLGVVAAIMPWNFPVLLFMIKTMPALMAGNTVVAKPAPTTPLTTLLLGEIWQPLLPAGVLNIIADRNTLGDRLTSHPGIAKITFTGSTATGKKVMANAAGTLKRLSLELGGNDPAIVLEDADVEQTARQVLKGAISNAGQICAAIKRVYVHDSLYDAFCDALARLAADVVVDDGLKQGTQMGPLQNKAQYEKVLGFIDEARRDGVVLSSGAALDRKGYFVAPTIVRDIGDDARLVREEQFGPVLPVLRYTDIDDAVDRANDTDYGLCATVWGKDVDRAIAVASRIASGTVWVNQHMNSDRSIARSAAKQSGIGYELGQAGLEAFAQQRLVAVAK